MRVANDCFRFLLELGLLASLAYWGWSEGGSLTRWILAVGAPLLAAAAWGRFLAPRSSSQLQDPGRLFVEAGLFGSAAGALVWAGKATWGTVFGALAALHLCLTFLLDQR